MSVHRCTVCGWTGDDALAVMRWIYECPRCKVAPLAKGDTTPEHDKRQKGHRPRPR